MLEQFVSLAQEFRITMPLYVVLCVKDLQTLKLQDFGIFRTLHSFSVDVKLIIGDDLVCSIYEAY